MLLKFLRDIVVCAPLVLFAYSGLLKWLELPIDPTVLFGGIVSIVLLYTILTGVEPLNRRAFHTVLVVLAFYAWYFITIFYTSSPEFWQHKALVVLLNVIAFIYPIICFRKERHFKYYENTFLLIGLCSAVAVWYYFLSDNLEFLIYQGFDKAETKLPDYLNIGLAIALAVLVLLSRQTTLSLGLAAISFGALSVLGARGPFVFLIVMAFFGALLLYRRVRDTASRYFITAFSIVSLVVIIAGVTRWEGSQLLRDRLSVFSFTTDILVASGRDEVAQTAFHVIGEDVVLGTGMGGYAVTGYNIDDNIYPHNLFLEAWAEAGVIGFALFAVGIVLLLLQSRFGLALKSRSSILYFVIFWFIFLNYMKSGGFIGARDLYMAMGVLIVSLNLQEAKTGRRRLSGRIVVSVEDMPVPDSEVRPNREQKMIGSSRK